MRKREKFLRFREDETFREIYRVEIIDVCFFIISLGDNCTGRVKFMGVFMFCIYDTRNKFYTVEIIFC